MKSSFSLICLLVLAVPLLADDIPYYGVRATYSMSTYASDLISVANSLFKQFEEAHEEKMTFSDVVYSVGSGSNQVALAIMNIKTTDFKWTEGTTPESTAFDEEKSELTTVFKDAKMTMDLSFDWYFEFSGIHGMVGTGKTKLESTAVEIVSDFLPEAGSFETRLTPTFQIDTYDIKGNYADQEVQDWIKDSLVDGMVKDVRENIQREVTDMLTTETLKHFTNVPNHSTTRNLPVGFEGELYSAVKQGDDQIVLSFRTDSVIQNRPYRRKVWRSISTDASTTHDLMICMNYQVLADVVEIMGKARGYFWRLTEDGLGEVDGIDYTINGFGEIMPSLLDKYELDEKVNIGCRSANPYDVIVQRPTTAEKNEDKYNRLQIPMECIFTVESDGYQFLKTYIFVRNYYTPTVFDVTESKYGYLKGKVSESYLHSFKIADSGEPISAMGQLNLFSLLENIAVLWDEEELCEDGLFYKPLRDMTYNGADVRVYKTVHHPAEEEEEEFDEKVEMGDVCFYYDEQYQSLFSISY